MTAQRQRVWIELYLVILKYGEYNDVQTSDNSQNFNHYSYCLNNPLKYVDPSGEAYYYTNNPKEIERFMEALKGRQTISEFDFDGGGDSGGGSGGWHYSSDADFTSRVTYNTSTGMFHYSYGTVVNGEVTIVGRSFPANLPFSSSWGNFASGGSTAMGVGGFGFSSYAAQRYHNSGGFETWRTSSGKYYNSNILKPQANGKYVHIIEIKQ